MKRYKYLDKLFDDSTRKRSGKQETNLAKVLRGVVTINSGATFGQNDIITDYCEVEAKTTKKESFSLTLATWRKLVKKCSGKKIPIMVVDFEGTKNSLAVLAYDDLQMLIEKYNEVL